MKYYFVYILASQSKTLYIGVTSNLANRVYQHKNKVIQGFTERYNVNKLVYFEQTEDVFSAIAREKQLKGWRREKKINLIESLNPNWNDLFDTL